MKDLDLLGYRETNSAVGPISRMLFLRSAEPAVRLHAVAALGRIGDAQGALPIMRHSEIRLSPDGQPR